MHLPLSPPLPSTRALAGIAENTRGYVVTYCTTPGPRECIATFKISSLSLADLFKYRSSNSPIGLHHGSAFGSEKTQILCCFN